MTAASRSRSHSRSNPNSQASIEQMLLNGTFAKAPYVGNDDLMERAAAQLRTAVETIVPFPADSRRALTLRLATVDALLTFAAHAKARQKDAFVLRKQERAKVEGFRVRLRQIRDKAVGLAAALAVEDRSLDINVGRNLQQTIVATRALTAELLSNVVAFDAAAEGACSRWAAELDNMLASLRTLEHVHGLRRSVVGPGALRALARRALTAELLAVARIGAALVDDPVAASQFHIVLRKETKGKTRKKKAANSDQASAPSAQRPSEAA
jgi:hypothetical protein